LADGNKPPSFFTKFQTPVGVNGLLPVAIEFSIESYVETCVLTCHTLLSFSHVPQEKHRGLKPPNQTLQPPDPSLQPPNQYLKSFNILTIPSDFQRKPLDQTLKSSNQALKPPDNRKNPRIFPRFFDRYDRLSYGHQLFSYVFPSFFRVNNRFARVNDRFTRVFSRLSHDNEPRWDNFNGGKNKK
jgi:hypothetical protein